VKRRERELAEGRSALDDVAGEAKRLRGGLTAEDREKLDEYLSSVRELELRLAKDEQWFRKPKPKADGPAPKDVLNVGDLLGRTRALLDLVVLALQSDSTRLATVLLGGSTYVPPIPGVTLGHHDLSHHGKDPAKLAQLRIIEVETLKLLAGFLGRLKAAREGEASVLDLTTVYLGSNLGDGSSHSIKNLPVLVAGGGFRHGTQVLAEGLPLCNLYVTLLRRLGLEVPSFGTSTGPLKGLDLAG
jgi:hypothetical protein